MAELLLLDSKKPLECASENTWCSAEAAQVSTFVNNIITARADADRSEKFRAMISGVPSPWARVTLTRKALAVSPNDLENTVIGNCYRFFHSEWRGLISAFVLHADKFEFSDPIFLRGDRPEENGGRMNILNVYGEMLFKDAPFWVLKRDKHSTQDNPSAIQVLYYKKNEPGGARRLLVGATSPFTFLFTSMNYDLEVFQTNIRSEIPWVHDGKFFDPLEKGHDLLSDEELTRLYSFICTMKLALRRGLSDSKDPNRFYQDYMFELCERNGLDPSAFEGFITSFIEELGRWSKEIAHLGGIDEARGVNIPVSTARPVGPLALLMPTEHTFYLSDHKLFASKPLSEFNVIKTGDIFLGSDYVAAWRNIEGDPNRDISKSAVFYLKTDKGHNLALPLSDPMIRIFATDIRTMVDGSGDIKLVAIEGNDGSVEVRMEAKLENEAWSPIARKTYQMVVIQEADGKVFVWPNFWSPKWKKYYYYSEFPQNGTGVRMYPFFGEEEIAEPLVTYPVGKVDATAHRYEIFRTKVPLKNVTIKVSRGGEEVPAGVLVIRSEAMPMKDRSLVKATVGIDFGSTNSTAYYKLDNDLNPRPVPFTNRRLAVVGFDNPQLAMAMKDELLFISNEGTLNNNGQLKSWLHLHDPRYISEAYLDKEIVGGVPVNESNLTVLAMDNHTISTNAGELVHNMKWLDSRDAVSRKESFMKMLWIQICADIFELSQAYPSKLYWSFPSAMGKRDRIDLQRMYDDIAREGVIEDESQTYCPSVDENVVCITESEAVCVYSMVKRAEVSDTKLVLGIDVGGSTSDILVMGEGKDLRPALFTQSSIRIAGGFFFDTVKSSPRFRQALFNFHESNTTKVKVLGIKDITDSDPQHYNRAPYYLNNIFDQLRSEDDFLRFYNYLRMNVLPVFALPAYVTGILMFYSGMLIRNIKEKKGMDLQTVNLRYYGKGGRLFDWLLDLYGRESRRYYQECFNGGYGAEDVKLTIETKNPTEAKSEVAMGLVSEPETFLHIPMDGEREIENFDVVGESGLKFMVPGGDPVEMRPLDLIPEDMFKGSINVRIPEGADGMEMFKKFLDVFLQFISEDSGGILTETAGLIRGVQDVKVRAFIQNDTEFRKATKTVNERNPTIYRMPIIIAEALNYLYDVLIPAVADKLR